jgi:DNA-binding transcriptional LysR family regulator
MLLGIVRIGTPEAFGIRVLAPRMIDFCTWNPGLHIELMMQPQFPSLQT